MTRRASGTYSRRRRSGQPSCDRTLRNDGIRDPRDARRVLIPRVAALHLGGGRETETSREVPVREEPVACLCECVGVGWRIEKSGLTVSHHFFDLPEARRGDRGAAAHVLEQLERREVEGMVRSLVRLDGDIELADQRRDLLMRDRAREQGVRTEPTGLDLAFELLAAASIAHDHEPELGMTGKETFEQRGQELDTMPRLIAADETQQGLTVHTPALADGVRPRPWPEEVRVDA